MYFYHFFTKVFPLIFARFSPPDYRKVFKGLTFYWLQYSCAHYGPQNILFTALIFHHALKCGIILRSLSWCPIEVPCSFSARVTAAVQYCNLCTVFTVFYPALNSHVAPLYVFHHGTETRPHGGCHEPAASASAAPAAVRPGQAGVQHGQVLLQV